MANLSRDVTMVVYSTFHIGSTSKATRSCYSVVLMKGQLALVEEVGGEQQLAQYHESTAHLPRELEGRLARVRERLPVSWLEHLFATYVEPAGLFGIEFVVRDTSLRLLDQPELKQTQMEWLAVK